MRNLFSRLRSDCQGSMAVEFALIAPIFLVLVFGVLQVGFALQNYNAVRNVSADVARFAVVQHQTGNVLSNSQIRTYAINASQGAPYLLDRQRVNAVVTTPETQRIPGVREVQITVTYQIDSMLDFAHVEAPFVTFTRPIFLTDDSASGGSDDDGTGGTGEEGGTTEA